MYAVALPRWDPCVLLAALVAALGLWERDTLRLMRITFALCAWALLLAAPRVHGLRPRDPAKLLAGPQSMRWRSDRDRATRATPTTLWPRLTGQLVEGPEVSPRTTWARSRVLFEPILVMSTSPPNSNVAYRVGRLERALLSWNWLSPL